MHQNEEKTGVKDSKVNRKYKDTLFRMIFREKENLLSLYNALNRTAYTDPEELEIYVKAQDVDLYGSKQIPLPFPFYVVFYNGKKEEEEYRELKLSDAFKKTVDTTFPPALECQALLVNINWGHNEELLEQCKVLRDYSYFVHEVREHLDQGKPIEEAVWSAKEHCIEKDILKEFLGKNSAEVEDVILEEFDQEWHEAKIREEEREKLLIELIQKKRKKGMEDSQIAKELELSEESLHKLMKE